MSEFRSLLALVVVIILIAVIAATAVVYKMADTSRFPHPAIAELLAHPESYSDKTVVVTGKITKLLFQKDVSVRCSNFGLPFKSDKIQIDYYYMLQGDNSQIVISESIAGCSWDMKPALHVGTEVEVAGVWVLADPNYLQVAMLTSEKPS